jgi:hypothetical protein
MQRYQLDKTNKFWKVETESIIDTASDSPTRCFHSPNMPRTYVKLIEYFKGDSGQTGALSTMMYWHQLRIRHADSGKISIPGHPIEGGERKRGTEGGRRGVAASAAAGQRDWRHRRRSTPPLAAC